MQEQIRTRLEALRAEQEAGEKMLADLDDQRIELQHTLLRIAGARQVLSELLEADSEPSEDPDEYSEQREAS